MASAPTTTAEMDGRKSAACASVTTVTVRSASPAAINARARPTPSHLAGAIRRKATAVGSAVRTLITRWKMACLLRLAGI
eukprot:1193484-Prorocentrum_minimum.AAC.8